MLGTVYFILFYFVLLSACHSIYPFYLFACCISFLFLSVSCFTLCATLYEHTVRIYLCMNVNVARACTSVGSGAKHFFCAFFSLCQLLLAHITFTIGFCNRLVLALVNFNAIDLTASLAPLKGLRRYITIDFH